MNNILTNILIKEEYQHYFSTYLTIDEIKELLQILENIQKKPLYASAFHGLYHSEKVMLNAFLLSKNKKLNDVDRQIIIDAALYHDIGRIDETEDTLHGMCSAIKIHQVAKSSIYQEKNNLQILKAICDGHSRDDKFCKDTFDNYDIDEDQFERYKTLYDILKDADALDRTRFEKTSKAALSESFLRFDFSRQLIEFSYFVNASYNRYINETLYDQFYNEYNIGSYDELCYHGIGFDFFKIISILENGILSDYAMERNHLRGSRNYNGNNSRMWISVVDAKNKKEAYDLFIKDRISFLAKVSKFHEGIESKSYSLSKGLPHKTDLYEDEKFVFDRIESDQILGINISKEILIKPLKVLNFLSCSLNYDVTFNKINYYIDCLKQYCDYTPDIQVISQILFRMQNEVLNFEKLNTFEQETTFKEYFKKQDNFGNEINHELQNWMIDGFQKGLGLTEDLTVYSLLVAMFKKINIPFELKENQGNILFTFSQKNKGTIQK